MASRSLPFEDVCVTGPIMDVLFSGLLSGTSQIQGLVGSMMGLASLCGIVDNLDGRWPSQRGASLRTLFSTRGKGRLLCNGLIRGLFLRSHDPVCFAASGVCAFAMGYGVCLHAASYPSFFTFFFHHLLGLVSGFGEEQW